MRNRYIDLLRAAAILRVVVYHAVAWPWLTIALPAMGVMFALAGSLTAASLERRDAAHVVVSRIRRLVPPLWALAAVAVPAMYLAGWDDEKMGLHRLAYWIVPVGDPPGSEWGGDLWGPLWYLRAYLWFVLLSPLLWWAYRRAAWAAVAAPFAALLALHVTGFEFYGNGDAIAWDLATYGSCWIAGFAHHDGRLQRLRAWVVAPVTLALGAAAMLYLRAHPEEYRSDLGDVPIAQALWAFAFVLLALWWEPPMGWLDRVRGLAAAVRLLNARAVTVYLWHSPAIFATIALLGWLALDDLGPLDAPATLAGALLLTAVAVVAFGWIEDLAGRRRPRLWPAAAAPDRPAAPTGADGPAVKQHWTHGPASEPDFLQRLAAAAPAAAAPAPPGQRRPAAGDEPVTHRLPVAPAEPSPGGAVPGPRAEPAAAAPPTGPPTGPDTGGHRGGHGALPAGGFGAGRGGRTPERLAAEPPNTGPWFSSAREHRPPARPVDARERRR
ncbi:acyltransferase family protein [Spirilliplanes yamanashiensis]|uniref:Acyltransferase 3 domain-containing protein n=1 Tax=Spirilliplanes yamanashiensis TaxID=42233 RepID=A0A8J4DKF4_9ACTN|nr:acyltransferase [Spirilliplanes yamanashiensis]MDP9818017.1 peptidoglycan/LPS O-acetylase OafA/YrhL [Spirilliplanes yamanashiensis]GIJ04826.1 hypothetical protein Sya03_41780 [Spirilliplanes yamanashiensis]